MNDRIVGGATVWLTGLPSAGKSTIATCLAERLAALGVEHEVLDGDEIRTNLSADLGFSAADRRANVGRIGFLAEMLARHGVIALVPVIAPYADSRAAVRERHQQRRTPYLEAYVDTPQRLCAERDVKGLYRRQRAGELTGLTGVDDPYEIPERPDLVVRTDDRTREESAAVVLDALVVRGLVGPVTTAAGVP